MKFERLRDEHASDPVWSELERLCRNQLPSPPDPVMQARVLARLERSHAVRGGLRLQPALVAIAILLCAGMAAAFWAPTARWLGLSSKAPAARVLQSADEVVVSTKVTKPTEGQSMGAHEPSATPPHSPSTREAAQPLRAGSAPTQAAARSSATTATTPIGREDRRGRTVPAPSAPDENLLVHSAVRALRVDHGPRRARVLLDEYLERYPHGVLVEDAVALEIEAAAAAGDVGRARDWARRYLATFPAGRFRATATRALVDESSKGTSGLHP